MMSPSESPVPPVDLDPLAEELCASACLACGYHWALPIFKGQQPLATLGWPRKPDVSVKMPRYALDFMRCLRCGHIYNQSFQYQQVPYTNNPNLMYNASQIWQQHLERLCQRLLAILPSDPVVIEIGCGQGGFLHLLASYFQTGHFIGFDPNGQFVSRDPRLSFRAELFEPARDLPAYQPDLILSRHVLEHLMNPLAFIQKLAFFSSWHHIYPYLFFEVPCVDRLLQYGRLEDLYYEHNSHFTTHSFQTMLNSLDCKIQFIERGYNEEVIFGLLQLEPMPQCAQRVQATRQFRRIVSQAQTQVPQQLQTMIAAGQKVVIWGGTGKGAAFIQHFELTSESFELRVIDSDPEKVHSYVPGTTYQIQAKEVLFQEPADVILIPSQWRAEDIVLEIQRDGIAYQQILIEHQGQLIDFFLMDHPYHAQKTLDLPE